MASHDDSVLPSSPPPIPRGLKRQASLLPAFEFDSSSPPRFSKRQALGSPTNGDKPSASKGTKTAGPTAEELYPTPVPTSSLGIPPSSPPPMPSSATMARHPILKRTNSMLSELRAPLTSVPSIALPINGDPVLMGRSSGSCDYQLSSSRLISRVHVRAAFLPHGAAPTVEIECLGWNGIKVHCQGHIWSLEKGDRFSSETVGAEIMLDVQDARVVLKWPAKCHRLDKNAARNNVTVPAGTVRSKNKNTEALDDWNNENVNPEEKSPSERFLKKKSSSDSVNSDQGLLRDRNQARRVRSPVSLSFPDSPTPFRVRSSSLTIVDATISMNSTVDIYEDEADEILLSPASSEEDDDEDEDEGNETMIQSRVDDDDEGLRELAAGLEAEEAEFDFEKKFEAATPRVIADKVSLGEPDEDEKEDPEQSQNIDPEPKIRASEARKRASEKIQLSPRKVESITGHLIDQLAFSRLSSTPLSTLFQSLPPSLSGQVTNENVLSILRKTKCIGEVRREGKDAVGKKLEDEYYYNMEMDDNEGRKQAVTETVGKSGLRACRKVHKQYFWKKPRV